MLSFSSPPASPAPTTSPGPTDDYDDDDGEDIPDNTNPVAAVIAKVYFVECAGIPDFQYDVEAPVGCRVHLDATPIDESRQHTRARGRPTWHVSDPSLVQGGPLEGDYTPVFEILRPGVLIAYVIVDGVRSSDVVVRFF